MRRERMQEADAFEAREPTRQQIGEESITEERQVLEAQARQRHPGAIATLAAAAVRAAIAAGTRSAMVPGRATVLLLTDLGQFQLPALPVAPGGKDFAREIHNACFRAYWDLPEFQHDDAQRRLA